MANANNITILVLTFLLGLLSAEAPCMCRSDALIAQKEVKSEKSVATPARPHAIFDQGVAFFQKGQYQEALAKFIASYNANEDPPVACLHQGISYYRLADYKRAEQMFQFTIDTFPDSLAAKTAADWLAMLKKERPGSEAKKIEKDVPGAILMTVPYVLSEDGHMLVTVRINDKPIVCFFDTGAEMTFFTSSQLARAGIKLDTQRSGARAEGIGGEAQLEKARVVVSLGGLYRPMTIYIQDDGSMIKNSGSDAIFAYPLLGQDFYGGLPYTIDDRSHTISFLKSAPAGRDPDAVPYTLEGRAIVVTPKVNGRECPMYLDTGASSVAFSDDHLAYYSISRPTNAIKGLSVGVGGQRQSYIFEIDNMSLGPIERKRVRATCSVHSKMGKPLLGRSFLAGLRFTIDPKAKLIHFEE